MSAATLAILMQVLQAVVQQTPAAINLFNTVKLIINQNRDPSADEWKAIAAQMASIHNDVQNALAARLPLGG